MQQIEFPLVHTAASRSECRETFGLWMTLVIVQSRKSVSGHHRTSHLRGSPLIDKCCECSSRLAVAQLLASVALPQISPEWCCALLTTMIGILGTSGYGPVSGSFLLACAKVSAASGPIEPLRPPAPRRQNA